MSIGSKLSALACAGAILPPFNHSQSQIECWAPGMSAPVTLTETSRSAHISAGKPFRCDIFGVAGKLELGSKANNATLVSGIFKEKLLGGLLGTGGTVQSTSSVFLQTGLTNIYPEKLSISGWSPSLSVAPSNNTGKTGL